MIFSTTEKLKRQVSNLEKIMRSRNNQDYLVLRLFSREDGQQIFEITIQIPQI